VQDSLGGTITRSYDGLDRLTKRGNTNVVYAGFELDPTQYGTEKYARSPAGEMVAAKKGSAETFVGENRHGDVGWYLKPTGTLWGTAIYDPWGNPTEQGQSTTLGYQGDLTDVTTGDVWMGARWYDVETAGFSSRDAVFGQLQAPVSLNRYTYASNDPLQYFDPDGRFGISTITGAVKKIGNVATKTWDNTGGRAATAVKRIVEPVGRVATATYETVKAVGRTAARTTAKTVSNVANATKTVVEQTVKTVGAAAAAVLAPIKACVGSETCRTIAIGAGVAIGVALCIACAPAVLAGAALGGAFGAATCNGDVSCVAQTSISGAAGGFLAPAAGAGLLATVGSSAGAGLVATASSQAMQVPGAGRRPRVDKPTSSVATQALRSADIPLPAP